MSYRASAAAAILVLAAWVGTAAAESAKTWIGREEEFEEYMATMGFSHLRDLDVKSDRRWLDKEFINVELTAARAE